MADIVAVEGLREFTAALRKSDRSLGPEVRKALNVVAEGVAADVRRGVPRRTGRAAASVKASSTATAGRLAFGGTKAPYYPWLDFGGKVGRNRSVTRPFIPEGRYVYPTIRRHGPDLARELEEALAGVIRRAGLD